MNSIFAVNGGLSVVRLVSPDGFCFLRAGGDDLEGALDDSIKRSVPGERKVLAVMQGCKAVGKLRRGKTGFKLRRFGLIMFDRPTYEKVRTSNMTRRLMLLRKQERVADDIIRLNADN